MKLSTFTKCKALPTKAEKAAEARFTSKPYLPQVTEVSTVDDLIEVICNFAWSPSLFTEFRRQDSFVSTDFIVLDIDDGMTIDEAEKVVHKLNVCSICLPSTSHTEEAHRFRLIFPLAKTISSSDVFTATMSKVAENFPADPACLNDTSRFYFGGKLVDGFFFDAPLLEPEKVPKKPEKRSVDPQNSRDNTFVAESTEELVTALYGEKRTKVPESIAYFLENAPDNLSGEWYKASNAFLFTCGLSGLDEDRVKEVFFSLYPYEELTEKKVDRMIQDGYDEREEGL